MGARVVPSHFVQLKEQLDVIVHFVTRLETSGEGSKPVDDETKKRVELYTNWLQDWAKDLPGQITIAANRTPYQWAIYRGDPPEKIGVLHPESAFLVGRSP